jgi:hypothetical protein
VVNGNYFYVEKDSRILVSFYMKPLLESFYLKIGAKKLSFEDALVQYPLFIKVYLDNSIKTKEAHKSKIFYIREVNTQ